MHYFYCLYNQALGNRQGVVDDSLPVNRQVVIDDFESIFMVPWSLHILIIDKLKNDPKNAEYRSGEACHRTADLQGATGFLFNGGV